MSIEESGMRVLVTGATGFVGKHTVEALLQTGHQVRALGRNPSVCRELGAYGAELVQADLRDHQTVQAACEGCDAVLHIGALSSPWGKRSDFMAINVDATANLIAGCEKHKVRRLVYVSSPTVTFEGKDLVLENETAPFAKRFTSIYSESKKLGEDLVNQAHARGLETVILRPKAVFGLGDTSLLPRIIAAARAGRLPQIGDGSNRVDLTYVSNVVQSLELALSSTNAVGGTYLITNNEHPQIWAIIREVLERIGLSSTLRTVPIPLASAAAGLMELAAQFHGREPLLTRYTVSILGRTQTYDISAAQRDLGYQPQIPLKDGIRLTLNQLQQK
jgi:nucleoside-diphosphate-sugar epimerase